MNFFDAIVYQPLFNALILFYQFFGRDLGIATIMLAALVKLATYPLMADSIKAQMVMRRIKPRLDKINEEYKNDKEKKALLTMELLQQNKVNFFSGIFLLVVQFAIIPPLYRIFTEGFSAEKISGVVYGFVPNPGSIAPQFFGAVDLTQVFPAFAVLAGVMQFLQMKAMAAKNPKPATPARDPFSQAMQSRMFYYMLPAMAVFFFWHFPAVVSLYWAAISLFSIIEQSYILKQKQYE